MMKKVLFVIIGGLIGSTVGVAAYLSKIYFPVIWKNSDKGSIHAFIFLGLAGGCMLAYLWLNEEKKRK